MATSKYVTLGKQVWEKVDKINAELFTLTYGSIVAQLMKDYENMEDVNTQLEKMGYNIGLRLVDEFLARSNLGRCKDFRETAEVIAKVGFKLFLGVTAESDEFSLVLLENPLTDFVELPENCQQSLWYCNILCGVIRGALEMLQMRVECKYVKCVLRGDEQSEIRVTLKEYLQEEVPQGDE